MTAKNRRATSTLTKCRLMKVCSCQLTLLSQVVYTKRCQAPAQFSFASGYWREKFAISQQFVFFYHGKEHMNKTQNGISVVYSNLIFSFFIARCYASAVLAMGLCLCLSMSVSVTSRCSTKTAKRRITQTTPHDTPGTLVFWWQKSSRNSTGVTPYGGAKCRWGGSKSVTLDKYLAISRKR